MKQIQLASAIALVMGLAVSSAASAMTTGGTITFTGVVTDATCTVKGGAGSDGGEGNFTVALEPVSATELPAAGATAKIKDFQVILGGPGQGTCENGKVARMSFLPSSPRIDPATGTLNNALTGEAGNTNVQVLDSTHAAIDLRDPANGVDFPAIANNTAVVDLAAQYYATNAATPGLVSTSVVYSVVYN
ncbi:fimbrial protein [Dyella sp. GSA-30]|uniref:fimbrial protein n=1 Tax=Dyella sp. GSA-30 TaxID=2994496 RepID=UPI0024908B81|nr:fimbrial protein [Dyella sp. GSA-30]BDU18639.1 fimbrial protein [Dyella sp. GSA-30]